MAGAPADFAGQVLQLPPGADPNYYKPRADTDAPYVPPMSGGATMQLPVYRGGAKMDTSSPAMNQMAPSPMQTVAAKTGGGQPLNQLVGKVRQKYPGAYDDIDDATLTKKLLAKYPGYADLAAPPASSIPRPGVNMQFSMGGVTNPFSADAPGKQIDPRLAGLAATGAGEGGYSDPGKAAATTAAGVAAGSALIPQVRAAATSAAKLLPIMAASEGINYARGHLPLGKYIPAGAEILPWLFGGGGKAPAAAEEEAAAAKSQEPNYVYRSRDVGETGIPSQSHSQATASEEEARNYMESRGNLTGKPQEIVKTDLNKLPPDQYSRFKGPNGNDWIKFNSDVPESNVEPAGTKVSLGNLTKEVPNPDPYRFSGAPQSMDIVQSTNVGKVGYNPDKKVMTVEYKNGFVYSYHGVPQEIYNSAKESESIGSYISRNVKGRYDTVRRGSVLVKKR